MINIHSLVPQIDHSVALYIEETIFVHIYSWKISSISNYVTIFPVNCITFMNSVTRLNRIVYFQV